MNVIEWLLVWLLAGCFLIAIVLPAALVMPPPNTGVAYAPQFYTDAAAPNWIVPITPECIATPMPNYESARTYSNTLFASLNRSSFTLSSFAWVWGQFVQHDLFLLTYNETSILNISLTPFSREMNVSLLQTRSSGLQNPYGCLETPNGRTGLLDGSPLYSDALNPGLLGTVRSGVRGLMKQSTGALLPIDPLSNQFYAADEDVNESSLYAALITLLVREHNYWASVLFSINPGWSDDQIFWKARSYVIAEIQAITFDEWMPFVFGSLDAGPEPQAIFPSSQVSIEYALVASEFFRSMINGTTFGDPSIIKTQGNFFLTNHCSSFFCGDNSSSAKETGETIVKKILYRSRFRFESRMEIFF